MELLFRACSSKPVELEESMIMELSFKGDFASTADDPFTKIDSNLSDFRKQIEVKKIKIMPPTPKPSSVPPLPIYKLHFDKRFNPDYKFTPEKNDQNQNSSFPYLEKQYFGGEMSALTHLENYLSLKLPYTYKETRNQLSGLHFSTKFSPWLSIGCISAKYIAFKIKEFENKFGANESTYWIWFELLWRDYFRFLHFKYGKNLYAKNGLNKSPISLEHKEENFIIWINGKTGNQLIDAGMKELFFTGYLSNRMRQIVASYLIYDLGCDWRKGAQWL